MELKEVMNVMQVSGERIPSGYYKKPEVDAVLAEKDKEIAELKQKLEDVNELVKESKELLKESQKMHQRCADNASKQIRRLKRALYKACAEWALSTLSWLDCIDQGNPVKWGEMRWKCLKKAEEYK